MTYVDLLTDALAQYCRLTKEIARREDFDPRLTVIVRDAQDRQPPVIYSEEPDVSEAFVALGDFLDGLEEGTP